MPENLQPHPLLDASLASIPADHRGALVVTVDLNGDARLRVATKLSSDGDWRLEAGVNKPWHGPVTGEVTVVGSW